MITEKLAAAIEEEMKRRSIKPIDVARMSGVVHSTIYNILNGQKSNPAAMTVLKLCAALGIDPLSLIGEQGDGEMPAEFMADARRLFATGIRKNQLEMLVRLIGSLLEK